MKRLCSEFGSEGRVNVTTHRGFVDGPWIMASPGAWISACPGIVMKRAGIMPPSKLLCYISVNSLCSVGAFLSEAVFPSIPLLGSQEPCRGREDGAPFSGTVSGSDFKAPEFCTAEESKMLFRFLSVVNKTNQNTKKNI